MQANRNLLAALVLTVVVLAVAATVLPSATSLPSGITRPTLKDEGCTCHNQLPASGVTVTLAGLPENFTAGQTYNLTITLSGGPPAGGENQGGFNLKVSAGTLTAVDDKVKITANGDEATHTSAGNDQRTWQVNWTAPADDTQTALFTLFGNAVNGKDGADTGDQWNKATAQVLGLNAVAKPPEPSDNRFAALLGMALLVVVTLGLIILASQMVQGKGPSIDLKWLWETVKEYTSTTDHKQIGLLYILTGLVFFIVAGLLALMIRVQLWSPNNDFLSNAEFNAAFTLHGTTMIFLAAMPIIFGFANYLVPLQIGARDLAFPRLNAFSFWLIPTGAAVIYFGYLAGGAADVGWTGYTPYSSSDTAARPGTDLWAAGQLLLGASSTITAINFITTILRYRAPGVKLLRMPLFTWSILVSVFMLLLAMPVFTVALVLLFMDRILGTLFYSIDAGGDPLLWQHLFWYFGHPEVYVVVVPAFGVISEVIATFARRPIFGYRSMVYAMVGIAIISFIVWGHHMFTSGADPLFRFIVMLTTMAVAVPTGIKIFNWLATLDKGALVLKTPMLFALGTVATFTIGGITGIMLASIPLDIQVHDTYFVVGHFHYTLIGGVLFGFFTAIYYWYPKMFGRLLNEKLGLAHFVVTFLAFHMTFYPMHELGIMGMPRRIATYSDEGWTYLNQMATVGAFIFGLAQLLLVLNMVSSLKKGQPAGDDPWGGWSLEWTISSPPPAHSFPEIPTLLAQEAMEADTKDETGPPEGPSPPAETQPAETESPTEGAT